MKWLSNARKNWKKMHVEGRSKNTWHTSLFTLFSRTGCGGRNLSRLARGTDCSFSVETAVATPERAIGSLQVGDQVEAYDPETGHAST